jgi:transposase
LYHGWGLKGYRYLHSRFSGGRIIFTVQPDACGLACQVCRCRDILYHGVVSRMWRQVPIGSKPIFLQMGIPRIKCPRCAAIRQVTVGFADERRSCTRAFERYALELSRHMTMLDVARHLNVGWDLIKDIQKRCLKKRFARPKLNRIRQIAIDEISIAKGQKYLTMVLGLLSGGVILVGDGNGAEALQPFWRRLKRSKAPWKSKSSRTHAGCY